jgi:hypothetical protein
MSYIVTDIGLSIVSQRIDGNGIAKPVYIGWGIGTTQPTNENNTLETEDVTAGYARVQGVSSIVTIGSSNDTYMVTGSIVANAALAITEWGLFTAATDGFLMVREVQNPGFTLDLGGILNFIFKIQISRCG